MPASRGMEDEGSRQIAPSKATSLRRLGAAAVVSASLLGWLFWGGSEPRIPSAQSVPIVEGPREQVLRPVLVHEDATYVLPTLTWLLGTWSQRDNHGSLMAPCDLQSAISFRSGGEYSSATSIGRYTLTAGRLLLWGRIDIDVDAGEDRSHIAERATNTLHWLSDTAMLREGMALFRCDKAANNWKRVR